MSEFTEALLCRPCLEKHKEQGWKIKPIARSNDQKGVCFWCGRKRYVGLYEIEKKE